MVINLGLTAISLFGVIIAIFVGIRLVSKEIEKRTLYTVLARPVRRWEFIVGKFFGLAGTLTTGQYFFMALGVFAALLYVSQHFQRSDVWVLVALYFIILQFLIVTALALSLSSFSSPEQWNARKRGQHHAVTIRNWRMMKYRATSTQTSLR